MVIILQMIKIQVFCRLHAEQRSYSMKQLHTFSICMKRN